MKRRIFVFIITLCLIFLSSCIPFDPVHRYDGEHTDLDVTAIYSIPGVCSDSSDSVLILENDQYGRTLYVIYLPSSILTWDYGASKGILAVLVMQKSDEGNVYFYGEQNYMFAFVPSGEGKILSVDLVKRYFSDAKILSLKESNRWGQEFPENDTMLSSAPLKLEKGERLSDDAKKAICEKVGSNIRYEFLRKDGEGRSLYFILSLVSHEESNSSEPIWYVAMIDTDETLMNEGQAIRKLNQSENISTQIMEFKSEYGWINH